MRKLYSKKTKKNKYNLILDIDETLLHSMNNNINNQFSVFKRPHLTNFLNFCFENFKVGFWTVGTQSYCDSILQNILTPEQNHKTILIISRNNISETSDYIDSKNNQLIKVNKIDNVFTKPLAYLFSHPTYSQNFKSNNTIIIDNNPYVTCVNQNNSILIPSFYNCTEDNYLLKLQIWFSELLKHRFRNIQKVKKPNFYNYN